MAAISYWKSFKDRESVEFISSNELQSLHGMIGLQYNSRIEGIINNTSNSDGRKRNTQSTIQWRASNLNIIVSDNGLSPGRRQAIIWTHAGILLI